MGKRYNVVAILTVRCLLLTYDSLNIFNGNRYLLRADNFRACLGNYQIILQTDTAKVTIIAQLVVIYDNLELTAGVKVLSVKNNIVTLEKVATGEKYTIPADCTIFASGVKSVCDLKDDLKAAFDNVHVIGDANKVGNLRTVIWGAWDVAMKL